MIPIELKNLFVPGSIPFFLLSLIPAVLLLFRKRDGGRMGRICVVSLVLAYWVLSTPIAAVAVVHLLSPVVHPVLSAADARGATAIVVLGAGMQVHQSRGASYGAPTREGSLRVLEAVRLHRLLGGAPIITTGGVRTSPYSESALMAQQLEQLGVPADKIFKEEKSTNTHDHALFVPPLLKQHGITQFVLVTSQQHIARALGVFHKVGFDPVPSTPEVYVGEDRLFEKYLPSEEALSVSESLMYDLLGRLYYRIRGWV